MNLTNPFIPIGAWVLLTAWPAFAVAQSLNWSTYYGGSDHDFGEATAVDAAGNVYVAGSTLSDAAIASGGHQNDQAGSYDAFLAKFDASGTRLWATYYGGPNDDFGYSCAVDADGNVYLAGQTFSSSAITSGGHQAAYGLAGDAYL
ncbi:MAG TPA: SBBP repeat-containing protein, partial [Flavobacteriales bacterium]|nr:SBBP repeat-containing protein [Flavobacteriales bacterium]